MSHRRVHLLIAGEVQGVAFRANASDQAQRLGLKGWVRNLDDGRVESVAEGPEEHLETFVGWCRRGPPAAQVSEVRIAWAEPTAEFQAFGVCR